MKELCARLCDKTLKDDTDLENSDVAVFCDGECGAWLHRWCAGIPKPEFLKVGQEAGSPFYCSSCHLHAQEESVKELRKTVQALAVQVNELRVALSSQGVPHNESSSEGTTSSTKATVTDTCSWTDVVKKKRLRPNCGPGERDGKGGGGHKGVHNGNSGNSKQSSRNNKDGKQHVSSVSNTRQKSDQHGKKLKPILGRRKIWGTLKVCPPTTVKGVITQLTSVQEASVQVKRKYKLTAGNKIAKWWHVVSGDESVLVALEQEWNTIQVQTSWRIEPCLSYVDNTPAASASASVYPNDPNDTNIENNAGAMEASPDNAPERDNGEISPHLDQMLQSAQSDADNESTANSSFLGQA